VSLLYKRLEWGLALLMLLVGLLLLTTAIFAPPVAAGGAAGLALSQLYTSGALFLYSTLHFLAGGLHIYRLKIKPEIRKAVLTLELSLVLFIMVLLVLISGIGSVLWTYLLFVAYGIWQIRDL
jgi:hypothetical protein